MNRDPSLLPTSNGNPPPTFSAAPDGGIRVVLHFAGVEEPTEERSTKTLRRFIVGKPFSSRDYAKRARVSLRTAALDLTGLERRGLVQRIGIGRATRWSRI